MAAPTMYSDEELYQQTGSWEAAAALRDEQNNALNQYNWNQPAEVDYFAQQFGPDTYGVASLVNDPGAAVTVSAPAAAASLPTYESVYDVFGGRDATNDLITTFRNMGLSEDTIASVLQQD